MTILEGTFQGFPIIPTLPGQNNGWLLRTHDGAPLPEWMPGNMTWQMVDGGIGALVWDAPGSTTLQGSIQGVGSWNGLGVGLSVTPVSEPLSAVLLLIGLVLGSRRLALSRQAVDRTRFP